MPSVNEEAQLAELAQLPKRRLAAMVLDLREQVRKPQDRRAVMTSAAYFGYGAMLVIGFVIGKFA